MAGGDSSQEKTEKPTRKRLEDARKEGQTVKSKELTSFFSLIMIFAYLIFMYRNILADAYSIHDIILKTIQENSLAEPGVGILPELAKSLAIFAFKILIVPVLLASIVSSFVAMIQVGGIVITPKAMEIKFDKFDIVTNAKNIFSMDSLKKFAKDILQLGIMGIVAFYYVSHKIDTFLYTGYYDIHIISTVFFKVLAQLFLYLLLIYLAFALIDYIIQWTSFMKKMMMSLEEIKKEMKDTEVSVQVKQRQREIHQEMMEEESMRMAVENSTMVVTNPNHIAIVILYHPEKVKLPAVILKATDRKAEIVKKLAKKYDIPIVRDVWLARQLHELAELKKYVPSSLVAAVADLIGRNIHLLPKNLQDAFSPNNMPKSAPPPTTTGPKKPGL